MVANFSKHFHLVMSGKDVGVYSPLEYREVDYHLFVENIAC